MVYLDTSVLVAVLTHEPGSILVRDWLEGQQRHSSLATGDWALVEFASVMGIRVRTQTLHTRQAREVMDAMGTMTKDSMVMHAPSRAACTEAASLVSHFRQGLRAGDALHLAVAMEAGAGIFATLDRSLVTAIRSLRLPIRVVNPSDQSMVHDRA